MIQRILKNKIDVLTGKGKAIILIGCRQIGKTTLLNEMFKDETSILRLNGDEFDVQSMLSNISSDRWRSIIGNKKIIVIDEAQRIENIGLKLKLITDNLNDVQIIATGSSSLDISNKINEPLTGRKWEIKMYPISFKEMVDHHGLIKELRLLPQRLVYGYYPEIVTNEGNEIDLLKQLTDSYLYKDILAMSQIKKSDKLVKLLQALAFQVGSQVSYNELANLLGLDSKTVESYINLLEQCYIIFRINSFSRNLRNELKTSKKIYFYDNGVRNALISNYASIENRNDIGALWENFLISERIKFTDYTNSYANKYFWRTKDQTEIDYLEEYDGNLHCYEFKWNPTAKASFPPSFANAYSNSTFEIIHRDNFEKFLGID
ncbi:MAG: ATP-binding protein [Paludibacteraceae bacterium]|nr:ATP-binding protein [Paludibacteraceae bacterium]